MLFRKIEITQKLKEKEEEVIANGLIHILYIRLKIDLKYNFGPKYLFCFRVWFNLIQVLVG